MKTVLICQRMQQIFYWY